MSALVDRITEVVAAHPQADEWGYPVEECCCGETFQGSYAAHVAERVAAALHLEAVLVKEGEVPPLYAISGWVRGPVAEGEQPTSQQEKS